MAEPIPQKKVPGLKESDDLGHVIDYFPTRNYRLKRWLPLVGGVIAILAAIGLIINLFENTKTAIQAHGPAILFSVVPLPLAIYLILLFGGIIFVILARIHWWDSITLFETGLIKEKRNKVQVWYYENTERFDNEITQIMFGGSIVGGKMKIVLEDASKRQFKIRNRYTHMSDLVQALRARVLPGLFQRARQRLSNGQVLHFGEKLKASDKGLEINNEIIPYEAIVTEVAQQSLKLFKETNPKKLLYKSEFTKIRNLDLLLDLIENPPKQAN